MLFNVSLIQSILNYKHTISQIEKSHVFPVDWNMLMRLSFIQSLLFKLNSKSHTEMLKWIYYNNWAFNLLKANNMSDGQQPDHQKLPLAALCIWLSFLQLWQNFFCPEATGLSTSVITFLYTQSFHYSFMPAFFMLGVFFSFLPASSHCIF